MYKLLIVDDEDMIVDGLHAIFTEQDELDLQVYRAYSGEEAIDVLNQTRIDVVLSDIRMPGISGLELQVEITKRWPDCKVIFLTGYNEFELVQKAVREGAVNYILKNEDDEEIIESVAKAIALTRAERSAKNFVETAKQRLRVALPALRSEYLNKICEGYRTLKSLTPEIFEDLAVKPDLDAPVFLVLGKVDEWRPAYGQTDKWLLLGALENIGTECFNGFILLRSSFEDHSFFWVLQPADGHLESLPSGNSGALICGTLENVQQIAAELLQLPVSFSTLSGSVSWHRIASGYAALKRSLVRKLGHEMLVVLNGEDDEAKEDQERRNEHHIRMLFGNLLEEDGVFDPEQAERSFRILGEIRQFLAVSYIDAALYSELYLTLISKMLQQLNSWGGTDNEILLKRLWDLLDSEHRTDPQKGLEAVGQLLAAWNDAKGSERLEAGSRIVAVVNQIIEDHLHEDLSLAFLSGKVYLNPAYLSRIYKSRTGKNLIDAINERRIAKANELLEGSLMKIIDIARAVGFQSPAYFSRLYKKLTGQTPQEHRDRSIRLNNRDG